MTQRLATIGKLGLGTPLLVIALLAMVVVPLPPFLLDLFFTFNIALSLVIMLAVIYVRRPLDFAVFPTVLLGVTLLRLALNVASTRVVLLHGHTGTDAAGRVIEAFGQFVIGGNYAVGIVVFVILVVINFMVVTKGAGRVSEVTARFTLDAMPGKQMAIDADLNAGLITQEQAVARRSEVAQEADFYGAMDGASKFVRGDAVAGILILAINIIGGLVIGTIDHGMAIGQAGRVYTLLTIGDGLVAQIPALLASTAVAVIVTRMSRASALGEQVVKQLVQYPRALTIAGGVLGVLGMLPGMPNIVFLLLASAAIGAGYWLEKRARAPAAPQAKPEASQQPAAPVAPAADKELGWEDVTAVDLIGLEVGYRLIPLVDRNQSGPLLGRIKAVRRKLSEELGFLVQSVHIRDNLELKPNAYRISILGVPVGEGEIQTERDLAINPGGISAQLVGARTKDPAFGLDAYWIEPAAKEHAQSLGFTVVDPATVVATHLSELLKRHAHQLLGHEEVQQLLDRLAKSAPKLVENLTPGALSLGVIVKVMQELLVDRVPVRNIRTIAETLAEHAGRTQDPAVLLAHVREALGGSIVQGIYGLRDELPVITLDPSLEMLLRDGFKGGEGGPTFEPGLADRLHGALLDAAGQQEMRSEPAVLLVPTQLRPWLARFTRHGVPNLAVLAYGEVPHNKSLRVIASVGSPNGGAARAPLPRANAA
ncbi:MAG TPA: flagellar biosynthesis protein FlhA [Gammaproteobacteria bacterium]|nr:flagellar biosynthesis protein FlhA [Gammaproteobacteria bacterium]